MSEAEAQAGTPMNNDAIVTREDANNYCLILTLLGMEEEGDPVAEVARLKAGAEYWRKQHAAEHAKWTAAENELAEVKAAQAELSAVRSAAGQDTEEADRIWRDELDKAVAALRALITEAKP